MNPLELFDMEWQNVQVTYLRIISTEKCDETLDEILTKIFNDESNEAVYKKRAVCEKWLRDCFNLLSNRSYPSQEDQIVVLLTLTKYICKDETSFINLIVDGTLTNIIYFSNPTNLLGGERFKILFLELLMSFLDHVSGINELLNSEYWKWAYQLIFCNEETTNIGYNFLTTLLSKTSGTNVEGCKKIISIMSQPLLEIAQIVEKATDKKSDDNLQRIKNIEPNILCLVDILERLLETYNATLLNYVLNLKVDLASDNIFKVISDETVCLMLARLHMILSFFKLSDVFDGIKTVKHDPLVMSGFLRIVESEIEKGRAKVAYKLLYYAFKYYKCLPSKLPKYMIDDKEYDTETQLIMFQLAPILLIAHKFDTMKLMKELDKDDLRFSHVSKDIIQQLGPCALNTANRIRDVLVTAPMEVYVEAIQRIKQYHHLYTRDHLRVIFEGLLFSLQDCCEIIKLVVEEEEQFYVYIKELANCILMFIESYNLGWPDSIKILDVLSLYNTSCGEYDWPTPIIVQSCQLMKAIIARRLTPTMSLLIDSSDDLIEIGPLLYQRCFTSDWEVRNVILEVVHTIAMSANKSFSSFKHLLIDVSIPNLVYSMAMNDSSLAVRATAYVCLREMIGWEEDCFPKNYLISRTLGLLAKETDTNLRKEMIRFLIKVYVCRELEPNLLNQIYKLMKSLAMSDDESIQLVVMMFWFCVVRNHLADQGWIDKEFPKITFSKKIVCLTNREIERRLHKALNDLSAIGCLDVLARWINSTTLLKESKACVHLCATRFYNILHTHDVTPESMLINQELPGISNGFSPYSDEMFQNLVNETEVLQDEDIYSVSKAPHKNIELCYQHSDNTVMRPVEYVNLIFQIMKYPPVIDETVAKGWIFTQIDEMYKDLNIH